MSVTWTTISPVAAALQGHAAAIRTDEQSEVSLALDLSNRRSLTYPSIYLGLQKDFRLVPCLVVQR